MASFDVNAFTKPSMLTQILHREVYPEIDPSNPKLNASDKVILITGASGQIGSDIAVGWGIAGAAGIILVGRNQKALEKTASSIKNVNATVNIVIHAADLTSDLEIRNLYKTVSEQFDKVHVLVNCAGSFNFGKAAEIDTGDWWNDFEINVKGPFLMSHHFIKSFGDEGTIINLSTTTMNVLIPGVSSYAASKLAMKKTGELLQLEYPNLRVFFLAPGYVKSNMLRPQMTQYAIDDGMMAAGMTLYLSLPEADYLKGGLCSVNWDIKEMESHKNEIVEKSLLKGAFLNARLGPNGHPWMD